MAKIGKSLKAKQYFYVFDLHSGVTLISLVGMVVMVTALIINLGTDNPMRDYRIVLRYLIVGTLSYGVLFFSAHLESKLLVIASFVLVLISFLMWICLLVLSYFKETYRYSCVYDRCPDMHWMTSAGWRNVQIGGCERIGEWKSLEEPIELTFLYNNSTENLLNNYKINNSLVKARNQINQSDNFDNFNELTLNGDNLTEYFRKDFKNVFDNNVSVSFRDDNMTVLKHLEEDLEIVETLNDSRIVEFRLQEPGEDFDDFTLYVASLFIASLWGAHTAYAIYTIFMYYLDLRESSEQPD
ncbi:uncharacterized protein isoform X2 [Rhodnius prolixus]|uniref:uncharacterized protein isoform X2 n=1 Tax=Rhodnius prolixus TaxID=13249 RepID=UPI003D18C4F7